MDVIVHIGVYIGIFVWSIVYAIMAIRGYVAARKQARLEPSEAAEKKLKEKKRKMIFDLFISGVVFSIVVSVAVIVIVLTSMPMAYM